MDTEEHQPSISYSKVYWTLAGYSPRFPQKTDPYFQITRFSILEGSLVSILELLAVLVCGIWSSEFVLGSIFHITWSDAPFKILAVVYLIVLHLAVGTPLMLFYWRATNKVRF